MDKKLLDNILSEAINLFKENNMSFGKSKLKKILDYEPNHFDALNLMGIALSKEKNYQNSLEFFENAIKINPNSDKTHLNMGVCLMNLKKFDDAQKSLKSAISINDQNDQAYFNLSIIYKEQLNFKDALVSINNCIKINTSNFFAWNFKGVILTFLKDIDDAIISFNNAIQINSKFGRPYINLAEVYKSVGQFDKSIEVYKKATLEIKELEEVYTNLSGVYLLKFQNHKTLDLKPAMDYSKKALSINKKNIVALNNLALINIYSSKINIALDYLNDAKKINPNYFNTYINSALAYKHLGNYEEAHNSYQKALLIDPQNADLLFRISETQLGLNNFKDGWENYEKRWLSNDYKKPLRLSFTKPLWKPDLGNKNILIWAEQGIGDQILFSTIFNDVIKYFEKIYVYLDHRLEKIYKKNFPNLNLITDQSLINEQLFDYHLPFGSLGYYFRKDVTDFEPGPKTLNVDENQKYTKSSQKLRCAISWKSTNPDTGIDKSINLVEMKKILKLENIDFYNIQYSNVGEEINQFYTDEGVKIQSIADLDTHNDIYGLMQFINTCDFVITVSNTNAHLSGILGKPTYLLLSQGIGKLWYWENEINKRNLWYKNIIKIKRSDKKNWEEPIENLFNLIKNIH